MSTMFIELTGGAKAEIDEQDYELVRPFKWSLLRGEHTNYAIRQFVHDGKRQAQLMHRLLMNAPADKVVDHLNGDGLCNVRSNLRVCTGYENSLNRAVHSTSKSGIKGVRLEKSGALLRWRGQVIVNGEKHRKWLPLDELAKAEAWCVEMRAKLHGAYAFEHSRAK